MAVQVQINAPEDNKQLRKRPAQSTDRPLGHDIERAARHVLEHAVEIGALVSPVCSADARILEYIDDMPTMMCSNSLQLVPLVFAPRSRRGDTRPLA